MGAGPGHVVPPGAAVPSNLSTSWKGEHELCVGCPVTLSHQRGLSHFRGWRGEGGVPRKLGELSRACSGGRGARGEWRPVWTWIRCLPWSISLSSALDVMGYLEGYFMRPPQCGSTFPWTADKDLLTLPSPASHHK